MAKQDFNSIEYNALLTYLCQTGLSNVWSPISPVSDPVRAMKSVVTNTMIFGNRYLRQLARKMPDYIDLEKIWAGVSPLICTGKQSKRVLHITANHFPTVTDFSAIDVILWDAGQGSRIYDLKKHTDSKGSIKVTDTKRLFDFSAGIASFLVESLWSFNKDYIAFIAADQIACLSEEVKNEMNCLLEVASSNQNADLIFFAAPCELGVMRLYRLIDSTVQPKSDSLFSLARERTLLKHYGGAHNLQCVLYKRNYLRPLVNTLQLLQHQKDGYELDLGIFDIAVFSRLLPQRWLKKQHHPKAEKIFSALYELNHNVKNIFPISVPMEVYNVNTSHVLKRLKRRIHIDSEERCKNVSDCFAITI